LLIKAGTIVKAAGAHEVVIADTIGSAAPAMVKQRMTAIAQAVPLSQNSVHLHDTRSMAVANAWAALEAGVGRFDASVGSIGGCSFASGAGGKIATDDLVLMAKRSGFLTGIQIYGLLNAIEFAEIALQRSLGGRAISCLRRQREAEDS
jgi:hydroxymethylglutaryl-CoA lyase